MAKILFRDTFFLENIDDVLVVEFAKRDGQVSYFDEQTLDKLDILVDHLTDNPTKGIVFAGHGLKMFSLGLDVNYLLALKNNKSGREASRRGQDIFNRLEEIKVPTVAAISGICFGPALELALACDYRIATNSKATKIGFSQAKLGLIPFFGGTQRLPRIIGLPLALKMIRTSGSMNVTDALEHHLVDELVDIGQDDDNFYFNKLKEKAIKVIKKNKTDSILEMKMKSWLETHNILGRAITKSKTRKIINQQRYNDKKLLYEASLEACNVGLAKGMKTGLAAETKAFTELLETVSSKALLQAESI